MGRDATKLLQRNGVPGSDSVHRRPAATPLVFLARPAGARVVPTNLWCFAGIQVHRRREPWASIQLRRRRPYAVDGLAISQSPFRVVGENFAGSSAREFRTSEERQSARPPVDRCA
jgi:hypothetical protein